jgi:hypothetical protein
VDQKETKEIRLELLVVMVMVMITFVHYNVRMIGGLYIVDHFGRLFQPKILTAENGWREVWNQAHWLDNNAPRYIERNMITGEERPCSQRG